MSRENRSGCLRFMILARLASLLFPRTATVRVRVTLYDAPPEYVDAWLEQEKNRSNVDELEKCGVDRIKVV